MAITPRLDLRQSQSLVMTPQLQQAIKLLQLSNVELSAYVEDELLRNPMLEREENVAGPDDAGRGVIVQARQYPASLHPATAGRAFPGAP